MSRLRKFKIITLFVFIIGVFYLYFGRIEQYRTASPDGKYVAIISVRPIRCVPLPIYRWGNHSDAPAFVSIEDSNGQSQGEVPIPMMQMARINWSSNTASISLIGEWDFTLGTCYYWDRDQNTKIYSKK